MKLTILPPAKMSWGFSLYIITLVFCFLTFNQGDLLHTIKSSMAYLDGHVYDFYDYNLVHVGGNDYLPLVYILFALWNLPVFFVVKIFSTTPSGELFNTFPVLFLVWGKILLALFFFASAEVLSRISKTIYKDVSENVAPISTIFATAPIAIFAVFIFGQYDVISTFFVLVGFYFYLNRRFFEFACFFSMGISIKYFPLAIYFPLILMIEKRIFHIIKWVLLGVALTAIQIILYWHSHVFRGEIFGLALGKVAGAIGNRTSVFTPGILNLSLYLIGCLFLYVRQSWPVVEWRRMAVFTPIAAYGLLFSAVVWHPQWIIIVVPFFCLSYIYVRNVKWLACADVIGMCSFMWLCVNSWRHNVDVWMVNQGVLHSFLPSPILANSDFMRGAYVPYFQILFYSYLFFPIFLMLIERYEISLGWRQVLTGKMLFWRYFLGVGFFVIPSIACLLLPMSIAEKINPSAFRNVSQEQIIARGASIPFGEFLPGQAIAQSFRVKYPNLIAVSVQMATYARRNSGTIELKLKDADGNIVIDKILDVGEILDNEYYDLRFPTIPNSQNKIYTLSIEAKDSVPGNAVTAWMTKEKGADSEKLTINGKVLDGSLVISAYFMGDQR